MNTVLKTLIKKTGKRLAEESPSILTGLGVTGFISTVIMAVKATPKAMYLLEGEEQLRYKNKLPTVYTPKETIKLVWKYYVPTGLVGLASIGCFIGANSISLRRHAALASLYSLTEATLKEYQEKVIEEIGKKKEEKIRDSIIQDRMDKNPVSDNQVIILGKGETLFYDTLSGKYFKSEIETIRRIINDFNQDLLTEMYKTLNDFYFELGLEPTVLGSSMGWTTERGLLDIRFVAKLASDSTPCIALEYKVEPRKL